MRKRKPDVGRTLGKGLARRALLALAFIAITVSAVQDAFGQSNKSLSSTQSLPSLSGWRIPLSDEVFGHLLFSQLEGRTSGPDNELRWDGEGWLGTDMNRLWIKSEGVYEKGVASDGDHEILYDRPVPRLRYFDVQAGMREDLDSAARRSWGAVGFEGLAPNFFQLESTLYFRDGGHVAGKVAGAYDLKVTQRLIAEPQVEMNFYSRPDPARRLGTGLTDLDTGIRIRYEVRRKLAPYIGFAFTKQFGDTAAYSRRANEHVSNPRFVFGLRMWY